MQNSCDINIQIIKIINLLKNVIFTIIVYIILLPLEVKTFGYIRIFFTLKRWVSTFSKLLSVNVIVSVVFNIIGIIFSFPMSCTFTRLFS